MRPLYGGCVISDDAKMQRYRQSRQCPTSNQTERNKNMKLTKTQIKEKRSALVEVILEIEKLKDKKTSLEKTLKPDFETNEAAYRNGVVTDSGILVRRPSWMCIAKPIVEVA